MSQTYPDITSTTTLANSLVPLLERDDATKSQFSGNAFPTTGLVVGMPTYRLDQGKLYVLTATSPAVNWSQVLQQTEGDARYLQLTGGDVSGTIGFGTALRQMLNLSGTTHALGVQSNTLYGRTNDRFSVYVGGTHSSTEGAAGTGGSVLFALDNVANTIQFKGNTVWHAGNDGAGSGLDADTVDGLQASVFVRSVGGVTPDAAGNVTLAGNQTFANLTFTGQLFGPNSFIVGPLTTGVFDSTALGAYSRVRAHSFRTISLGYGEMSIEGPAIDAGATIRIGTGVAGGNTPKNVEMGASLSVASDITSGASDGRLKKNFEPITGALDKLDRLGAFYFQFNDEAKLLGVTDDTEKRRIGVVAQEVMEVLPEAVFPAPANAEFLTVQYEKLVPLLIAAIRELRAELKEMQR
jgi:hypothetical protein